MFDVISKSHDGPVVLNVRRVVPLHISKDHPEVTTVFPCNNFKRPRTPLELSVKAICSKTGRGSSDKSTRYTSKHSGFA